jgi:hypothetical protein
MCRKLLAAGAAHDIKDADDKLPEQVRCALVPLGCCALVKCMSVCVSRTVVHGSASHVGAILRRPNSPLTSTAECFSSPPARYKLCTLYSSAIAWQLCVCLCVCVCVCVTAHGLRQVAVAAKRVVNSSFLWWYKWTPRRLRWLLVSKGDYNRSYAIVPTFHGGLALFCIVMVCAVSAPANMISCQLRVTVRRGEQLSAATWLRHAAPGPLAFDHQACTLPGGVRTSAYQHVVSAAALAASLFRVFLRATSSRGTVVHTIGLCIIFLLVHVLAARSHIYCRRLVEVLMHLWCNFHSCPKPCRGGSNANIR